MDVYIAIFAILLGIASAKPEITVTSKETKPFCGGENTNGLNEKCFGEKDCLYGMRCIDGHCKCGNNYVEMDKYGTASCVYASGYNQYCSGACKKPMSCTNNYCQCPEGLEFNKNMGICFKECKKNELFDLESGNCLPGCGKNEFSINNTCVKSVGVGEACEIHRQCKIAFSSCENGVCECKPGFSQEGTSCKAAKYKCPFGEAHSTNGKITECVETEVFNAQSNKEVSICPDNYFCVKYAYLGTAGHCCPQLKEKCPVGDPLKDVACDDKKKGGDAPFCPKETHTCVHHLDGIASCCPKPCASNGGSWPYERDILYKGSCYPVAKYGERCKLDEQCKNHKGVCRNGTCHCGENAEFNINHEGTAGCHVICKLSEFKDWTYGCRPRSKIGEDCSSEQTCPYNGKCVGGKCECKCNSVLYGDYYCVEENSLQCLAPSGSQSDASVKQKDPVFCLTKDTKKDVQNENIQEWKRNKKFKLVEKCPNGTYCFLDTFSNSMARLKLGICCQHPEMVCPSGYGKINSECKPNKQCDGGFCHPVFQPADDDQSTEGNICCSYDAKPKRIHPPIKTQTEPYTTQPYTPSPKQNYMSNSTEIYPPGTTTFKDTLELYGRALIKKINELFKW